MTERFITSTLNRRDPAKESSLRPPTFDEFPGQARVKEQLELFVRAAKERDEALDHILLCGPPGLGKTTLAYIIANERGTKLKSSSGPAIEKPGDLAGLLTSLEPGDVLFIDEIHRLSATVEEYLYSAMEDFFIDIMLEQGAGARSVRLNVPRFTLIGATTRLGMISAPLRARFGLNMRLDYYDTESLMDILKRSAGILDVPLDDDGARQIASRCRGTPVSPIICCAAPGIMPRSEPMEKSPARWLPAHWKCCKSILTDWMRWTCVSLRLSSTTSAAGRWG